VQLLLQLQLQGRMGCGRPLHWQHTLAGAKQRKKEVRNDEEFEKKSFGRETLVLMCIIKIDLVLEASVQ